MPLLALLYFVNYLDRVNIGFAGPNGMNRELGLTATVFGLASGVFFLGYLLLEVPSNLALHRFGAHRWLARILVSWGIIATAMAFVPDATVLVVLRFLLGVAEAGFFPGIILYLTYWSPAEQRARAVALFMAAVPVSTAVGSLVSSLVIASGDGVLGLTGWRVMFLVEGIPAIILAAVTFWCLTDRPSEARWLPDDERAWLVARLEAEARETEARETEGAGHWPLRRALTSPRILALAFVYFGITYGLYALGFFLPTIVAGFEQQFGTKLSVVERGLVTAIPYVGAAVAMVLWGRRADTARGVRGTSWYVAAPSLVGGLAIPIALYLRSPWLAMIAVTVRGRSLRSAGPVLGAALAVPHRCGRGGRDRAGQLARQRQRVRRAVRDRLARRPHRHPAGRAVGGGRRDGGGSRRGGAGRRADRPGTPRRRRCGCRSLSRTRGALGCLERVDPPLAPSRLGREGRIWSLDQHEGSPRAGQVRPRPAPPTAGKSRPGGGHRARSRSGGPAPRSCPGGRPRGTPPPRGCTRGPTRRR
jgi:MFS family permease